MTSPVALNTPVHIYQKGATINWLTDDVSKTNIKLITSKSKANVWVIQRVGTHYTIKVNDRNQYLAYGSPKKGLDCTALLTSNTKGKSHLWDIVPTSTGVKIKTVEKCQERDKKTIQFLKVAGSGGTHLELSSKDSDIFFVVKADPGKKPDPPKPGPKPKSPTPTTPAPPAPVEPITIKIHTAAQVPKIVALEPLAKPYHYLAPRLYKIDTASNVDGSIWVTPTRTFWYTRPWGKRLSLHANSSVGPHMAINPSCTGLVVNTGIVSPRAKFSVGFVPGSPGFIIRVEGEICSNGKPRYLILQPNGTVVVTPNHPTKQTLRSYLWRFSVGTNDPVSPGPVTPGPVTPGPVTPGPVTPDPVTLVPLTPGPTTPAPPNPTTSAPPTPTTPAPPDPTTPPPPPTTPAPPFPTTPAPWPYPDQNININIEGKTSIQDPRVMFPYPVTPDLLLGVNPDGSLNTTGTGLLTPAPSPTNETPTVPAGTGAPDADMTIPDFDGGSEFGDDGLPLDGEMGMDGEIMMMDEEPQGFFSFRNILIMTSVLIVLGVAGYYIYKSYNGGSSNNGGNAGGRVNNAGGRVNNAVNIPSNVNIPTNFGNLQNTANFGTNVGGANTANAFADGFNDFANVENIGPPPPTTR